jgi:16S rRNA G966 N2-methylase RsmD
MNEIVSIGERAESDIVVSKLNVARQVADISKALEVYSRQQKLGKEVEQEANAIFLEAMRRCGEMLLETDRATGTRGQLAGEGPGGTILAPPGDQPPTLAEMGLSKKESALAQKLAALPDEDFEEIKAGAITIARAAESARRERIKSKAADIARAAEPASDCFELMNEKCENALRLPAASVDWIITDPPYPREFLQSYDVLGQIATHVLKPGGSLLCMTGQSYLPDVVRHLDKHLTYNWTLAYLTFGQATQIFPRRVNVFWKPVLWYVKGKYDGNWVVDVARSQDNDKRFHEWGQSESGMRDLTARFVKPVDVVLDPFMGAGTTGVIALELGARFIGFDSDKNSFNEAVVRLDRARMAA